MSILDTVMNLAEKHPQVNDQQHSTLVQSAAEMFGHSGGISELLGDAERNGIGGIVQSWIGSGSNQPVSENQVERLIGQDRLNQLASRAGIPPAIASAALARILPTLVDRFTPHGRMPEAA